MTLMLLAANTAGCMPHAPKLFFYETTKDATGKLYLCSLFELGKDHRVFMKLTTGGQKSVACILNTLRS